MDVPLWPAILIELCLLILTLFSTLFEAVADGLSESRLERMKEDGDLRAGRLLDRFSECRAVLSAVHTALCLLQLAMGAVAAAGLARPLSEALQNIPALFEMSEGPLFALCLVIVLLALCLLTRFLGAELPRRMAQRNIDALTRSLLGPMLALRALLRPMTALIDLLTGAVMRLMGEDPSKADENVTEDEILAMVDMGEESGSIESNEKELIENIFEFNSLTAEDCMVHRTDLTAIDADTPEDELIGIISETGFSRFPVYGDDIDDILGILTTRAYLLNARLPEKERKGVRELLIPAFFVPENMRADVLFHEMQSRKSHMAVVVDEYGGTSGLVTLEDLLEEIVGNIYDEFDQQAGQEIIPQPDGSWRVAGSVELEPLCEALGIDEIESEEFDTLGGLVFSQLTAIPEDGSHPEVECFGLRIRVDELADRRVEWATVRKIEPQEGETEERG
ncbi:MAG: HlyC/CorC family transporter [Clostridia bacterium]|nr:HlyC/CorC family transporter [Clostridia bacterium]